MKIVTQLLYFIVFTFGFYQTIGATTYEIYIPSWTLNPSCNDCSIGWPICEFSWSNNTYATICFADFTFPGNNSINGVTANGEDVSSMIPGIVSYVHNLNGKVKISFGGSGGGYHLWDVSGWNDFTPNGAGTNIITNLGSIVRTYSLDGIDLDFEGDVTNVSPSYLLNFLQQLQAYFGYYADLHTKIISLTMPSQFIGFPDSWGPLVTGVNNNGNGAAHYVDYVNFMEYCNAYPDISNNGNNALPPVVESDINSYITYLPYNKMGLGMSVENCSGGTVILTTDQASELSAFANSNGLANVFLWDITQEINSTGIACPIAQGTLFNQMFPYSATIINNLNTSLTKTEYAQIKFKPGARVYTGFNPTATSPDFEHDPNN